MLFGYLDRGDYVFTFIMAYKRPFSLSNFTYFNLLNIIGTLSNVFMSLKLNTDLQTYAQ